MPHIDIYTASGIPIDVGVMEAATVSSKYQIVIPRSVRKAMDIRPGQEIQVIIHEGRIELLPVRDV